MIDQLKHTSADTNSKAERFSIREIIVETRRILIVDDLFEEWFIKSTFKDIVDRQELCFGRVNTRDKLLAPLVVGHLSDLDISARPYIRELVDKTLNIAKRYGIVGLKVRRAQINFNTFGEMQLIHQDGDSLITALYIANPKWHVDWLGEICFYDSADTEVLAAITPLPGRLILFDGGIHHRGGVPSRLCFRPRVVVAIKFS